MPAELDYQHPETPYIPPPWARWWIEPLRGKWRWLPTLLGLSPMLLTYLLSSNGVFDPAMLYVWLIPLILGIYGVIPMTALAFIRTAVGTMLRRRYRVRGLAQIDVQPYLRTIWIMAAITVLLSLGLPMRIAFLLRLSEMNAIRTQVEKSGNSIGSTFVLPFHIRGAEKVQTEDDRRYVIVLYTSDGGFPGGGSGFIYVPEGTPFPSYNQGNDGWLFGRWYWFVTD